MLAAGQAGHLNTEQTVNAWAGEITKKWGSLVTQKQKAREAKAQALTTVAMQEGDEGDVMSRDGGLSSQPLDLNTHTGRCVVVHTTSSISLCHQAIICTCCTSGMLQQAFAYRCSLNTIAAGAIAFCLRLACNDDLSFMYASHARYPWILSQLGKRLVTVTTCPF